jgi:cyclopropane-fatty-acyl-phospholipid synthase
MDPWLVARIFPGAYFPSLAEIIGPMGEHGLHPADVESLGPHYASPRVQRQKVAPVVTRRYDQRFVRMWRLYLRASAAAFRVGNVTVWQIQFTGAARRAAAHA